jgi:hypothetical protein
MNKTAIALTGVALGAGAMYLFDPVGGRRRRARLGETVTHASHRTRAVAGSTARHARHRLSGVVARTVGRVAPGDTPSDDVVEERVRARLGRLVSHPGAIDVAAAAGTITLTGAVLAGEVDELLAGVADVPGVAGVENRLESHADAAHVSSLQGAGRHVVPAPQASRRRWTPAMAGVALGFALLAIARRGLDAGSPTSGSEPLDPRPAQ